MSILKKTIFYAAAFFCLATALVAQAIVSPQVYFTAGLVIEGNSFSAGDKISGTVELWNYENAAMNDLVFNYQLLSGEDDGVPTQLVDNSQKSEIFSLAAQAKETKKFEYLIPKNLESGSYTFRIQLTNARGERMSRSEKIISIGGNGKFVTLEKGAIVKGGEDLSNGAGVYYLPGETVTIKFTAVNSSGFTIKAVPVIVTYNRNVGTDVVNRQEKNEIVLNPNEKKVITYDLFKTNIPETYLSEVKLLDSASKESISNAILFRWIMSGEGARTLYVTSDKTAYEAGDEAKINVNYNGSADQDVETGTGDMVVKLSDPKGEVIGETSQQVKLEPGSVTVAVPVEKDADKFKIDVTLSEGNKGYDSYEVKVVPEGEQWEDAAPKPVVEKETDNTQTKIVLGSIALVILIIIMYIFSRKKKNLVVSCFLLAFMSLFAGTTDVLAWMEVTDGCSADPIQIFPSEPAPGTQIYRGGTITFKDDLQVHTCGDGLFFNKANFYITEDSNIPVVDADGHDNDTCSASSGCTKGACLTCFGAGSSTYDCAAFGRGDEVKRLDTASGYKIYKLGTAIVPDVGGTNASDWPHIVEFNKTFAVPADIDIYGPVRLYVEYVGTHWDGHWHWYVGYENGYLRATPSAGDLTATQPDYCTMNPAASFKWDFASEDGSASQASYRIQISKSSGFSPLVYDSSIVNSSSGAFSIPVGILDYNKKYYWRLMVIDNYGTESEWMEGDPIITPAQPAPHPAISYSPKTPIVMQRMDFSSASSYCYSGATKIACTDDPTAVYYWDFGNGKTSSLANDSAVFPDKNQYSVSLRISSGGLSCTETKVMIVNESLPTWQEVGD